MDLTVTLKYPGPFGPASASELAGQSQLEKEGLLWPQQLYLRVQRNPPIESVLMTPTGTFAARPSQPLWRFALVGLGPLTAMGIFALLVAFSDRLDCVLHGKATPRINRGPIASPA